MTEPVEVFEGEANFDVPDGVDEITIGCHGGRGDGGAKAGNGGFAKGVVNVSAGDTLYIRFTKGGENGGDFGGNFGGDGADVRIGGTSLEDRVIVAGGGGSSALGDWSTVLQSGAGGPDEGEDGEDGGNRAGEGGTQTEGGSSRLTSDGEPGEFGFGGDGGERDSDAGCAAGGGGWYGGSGAGAASSTEEGFGAGGGSNYLGGVDEVISNERGSSDQTGTQGKVTLRYAHGTPSDVTISTEGGEITLTWSDPGGEVDKINIYRSDEPGVDVSGEPHDTVDVGVETYLDAVGEGRQFYYRLTASGELPDSDPSDEVDGTTTLPAPTDLTVDDFGDDFVSLSWTDNSADEDGYRVDLREDDEGDWGEAAVLESGTESATVEDLLNGQLYGVRVVAFTADVEEVDE